MTTFAPGTRVVVQLSGHLNGRRGVVIEMKPTLLNGHDVCVELDEGQDPIGSWPLCFYAHELAVEK